MFTVAVVGATSWGATLAVLLARKGIAVALLARTLGEAAGLERDREHRRRLPGIPFPPTLTPTADPAAALATAKLVILAVPSQTMRANLRAIAEFLPSGAVLMSVAKGLEIGTGLRMSQVIAEETPPRLHAGIAALSGPNLSAEIAQELPSATVIGASDQGAAETAQELVRTDAFRAYTSRDVVGVELGGTLKNIIALGAGMSDGWGYGANAKAAYMTRGLAEITRFGVAAGADPLTFLGLAGFGDLVATCMSPLSRNRSVGEALAKGRALADIQNEMHGISEGVPTTRAAWEQAHRLGVEMPITEQMYKVLFEGLDPHTAVRQLLSREPHEELGGGYGGRRLDLTNGWILGILFLAIGAYSVFRPDNFAGQIARSNLLLYGIHYSELQLRCLAWFIRIVGLVIMVFGLLALLGIIHPKGR